MALSTLFKDIANAIRAKDGTTGNIVASTFPERIRAIKTGIDTSDATAVAANILSGKTAYAKGAKLTGTIASKTASDLTASGATVTVPAGHYASQATKSVETATQATPSISVDAAGKITASATQTAGYVAAGTKSATQQLTTQAAQTITPGTDTKTAVAKGKFTTGDVKVAGDANLTAKNIKSGTSIFGVAGILESLPSINTIKHESVTIKNGVLQIPNAKGCKFFGMEDAVPCIDNSNGLRCHVPLYGFLASDDKYYGIYINPESSEIATYLGLLTINAVGTTLNVVIDPIINAGSWELYSQIAVVF